MNEDLDLQKIVDDKVTRVATQHIIRGTQDVCLEYFGEQDEECLKYNANPFNHTAR